MRALYGGKEVVHNFHNHLRDCMINFDFIYLLEYPDFWIQPGKRVMDQITKIIIYCIYMMYYNS